jgi:C4-dicarboxylate transporter, DctM subunit
VELVLVAMAGSLLVFLLVGVPIGLALLIAGIVGLFAAGHPNPANFAALRLWAAGDSFILTAVPLFIFMAELAQRTRIMDLAFRSIAPWAALIPGRLLHSNVIGSTLFAAVSGSSAATCATMATLTLPELQKRGYPMRLVLGSLAGPATLGILIPPSIVLIVYGALVMESIRLLFIAGVVPGLLLAFLFSSYLGVASHFFPPPAAEASAYGWRDRWRNLPALVPVIALILGILGGIYLGWVTPTEAAAWGVLGVVLLGLILRTLTLRTVWQSLLPSVQTTCMVLLIYVGAAMLSSALAYVGAARAAVEWVSALPVSRYVILVGLYAVYLLLGMFFEGFAILVMTAPLVHPVIKGLGFDGIWFGIVLTILIEIALITPPVGFNLFIVQGVSGASLRDVIISTSPMVLLMMVGLALVTIFPEIALWLPRMAR